MITSVQTSDADGDTVTVTVDDDRFEVSDGHLRLKANESLDYETAPTVEVTITASDGEDSTTAQVTISVTDVPEPPPPPPPPPAANQAPSITVSPAASVTENRGWRRYHLGPDQRCRRRHGHGDGG